MRIFLSYASEDRTRIEPIRLALVGQGHDIFYDREDLKPGEEVVTSGVFKLRPGAAVVVNNETMPSNSATPKPEDS